MFAGTSRHSRVQQRIAGNDGALTPIAICNKCEQLCRSFFDTLNPWHACHATRSSGRAWRKKVKKIIPFVVAAALGVGFTTAAEAHVSVGIGIGVPVGPVYPAYPVYAPPPVYYAPPPAPVVYAPPVVVVGGGYGYYGYRGRYYGRGYYGHGGYGHGGYYRR
jgi:hypothetical protein